jgi:hypothetical protein
VPSPLPPATPQLLCPSRVHGELLTYLPHPPRLLKCIRGL